jgi:hypothetical protein
LPAADAQPFGFALVGVLFATGLLDGFCVLCFLGAVLPFDARRPVSEAGETVGLGILLGAGCTAAAGGTSDVHDKKTVD